ncbi:diguanylate cyclase domain-containing protein [Myxococcota bacterium]
MGKSSIEAVSVLRKQRKERKPRRIWMPLAALALWSAFCLVGAEAISRLGTLRVDELADQHARAVFQTVVDVRAWNASHGGVYVPADLETPANPYLPEERRAATTEGGQTLALVNPAYMTRKIGEISAEADGPAIRVTSLNPIRPENAPLPWERRALTAFENGAREYGALAQLEGQKPQYRFAAPLLTETSCLACHTEQGYQIGDIRGAVTLSLPAATFVAAKTSHRRTTHGLAVAVWLLGVGVILLLDRVARARRRALDQLKELSLREPLTGLNNRRGFEVRSEQALRTLAREKGTAVLAFADLDRLKELNDKHGHPEGDAALIGLGQALGSAFRCSDVVGRIGGDEFAILLVDASWEYRDIIERRIQDAVDRANDDWDGAIPLGLSVGLVPVDLSAGGQPTVEELLAKADERMYEVKKFRRTIRDNVA